MDKGRVIHNINALIYCEYVSIVWTSAKYFTMQIKSSRAYPIYEQVPS